MAAMADIAFDLEANPHIYLGANNPPEPTPFDAFEAHIGDLIETAKGFLDGEPVADEAVASKVSQLLDECRKAAKDADKARAEEKKPHDEAAKAVQAKWKPLLERADLAAQTCKDALKPYLEAQEAEKRRVAEQARLEAEERARAAAEAARAAAESTDLQAREEAEQLVKDAKAAEKAATKAESDRGRSAGGARATTLRTYHTAVLTDGTAAARWAWAERRADMEEFITGLAQQAVNAGRHTIPGFDVQADTRVV